MTNEEGKRSPQRSFLLFARGIFVATLRWLHASGELLFSEASTGEND